MFNQHLIVYDVVKKSECSKTDLEQLSFELLQWWKISGCEEYINELAKILESEDKDIFWALLAEVLLTGFLITYTDPQIKLDYTGLIPTQKMPKIWQVNKKELLYLTIESKNNHPRVVKQRVHEYLKV